MLIDELNHRVKNTLSTVQSIVWQTLRTTIDPKAIRQSIESRLFDYRPDGLVCTMDIPLPSGARDG